MSPKPSKEELCSFVEKSISNKQFNEELIFDLPLKSIERIKNQLPFNMSNYICVISSHSIRHIKKRHFEDLHYICKIVDILENFDNVKKSLTKCQKTGANLVSLEFYKKYNNDRVKLRVFRNKRLELKTLFVEQ